MKTRYDDRGYEKANFNEKVLAKDGSNIHYWVSKDRNGPWVILLHAAGIDHRMFDDQVTLLYGKFCLLLMDARGHGLSKPLGQNSARQFVDDLMAIMEREGCREGVFIGHSFGGNLAQEVAFCYPAKVKSLVLIDCTDNTAKLTIGEKLALRITPTVLNLYPWRVLIDQSARLSSIKPEVQDYLKSAFAMTGKTDFIKIYRSVIGFLHPEEDYKINKSMLLICGEEDNLGNIKKTSLSWAASEPDCSFYQLENAGHCSNQDNPVKFNSLLVEFLNKQGYIP